MAVTTKYSSIYCVPTYEGNAAKFFRMLLRAQEPWGRSGDVGLGMTTNPNIVNVPDTSSSISQKSGTTCYTACSITYTHERRQALLWRARSDRHD